jgi:hypothetical protein
MSTPAATNHGAPRRKSSFPDCRIAGTFCCSECQGWDLREEAKEEKTADIAYKFLCSFGEARRDRSCI